ncbi:MAG: Na(+)/H(+) antiporter subunit B [Chromatiales bacterium]|jgi:multicomponent Na+:H+ antiporter subunit B|nr:Na(+)/H(+) antiporter subunit B [Chromatiales bacterium]
MLHHTVLRVIAKLLVPVILLFAFYVQFHGDYSPGGGFQAGVIFAAGIILYALIFGLDDTMQAVPPGVLKILSSSGVLLYAGVGLETLLLGGNYLDYDFLAHEPTHGQHLGILLVELGVGITVASTMLLLYYAFAGREQGQ